MIEKWKYNVNLFLIIIVLQTFLEIRVNILGFTIDEVLKKEGIWIGIKIKLYILWYSFLVNKTWSLTYIKETKNLKYLYIGANNFKLILICII